MSERNGNDVVFLQMDSSVYLQAIVQVWKHIDLLDQGFTGGLYKCLYKPTNTHDLVLSAAQSILGSLIMFYCAMFSLLVMK